MTQAAHADRWLEAVLLCGLALLGCSDHSDADTSDAGALPMRQPFTPAQARDATKCRQCHPNHYNEWSGSMHAYAAKDPVFLAMNRRGQRETNGELGDFCVRCHAPLAVRLGLTKDGLNLEQLPDAIKGVTCYACHNADGIEGHGDESAHNATLHVTDDVVMRGPIAQPKQPVVHRSEYSEYFDGNRGPDKGEATSKSSQLCGGCHDIVTHSGVHLERTFEEYRGSLYTRRDSPQGQLSCASCHMRAQNLQLAAIDPASHTGTRTVHEHLFAGIDAALTEFPYRDAQKLAIECLLQGGPFIFSIEPDSDGIEAFPGKFNLTFETDAGHDSPSGASQDRRMWLEVTGYDASDNAFYRSGHIADGELEEKPEGDPARDQDLWLFRDRIFGRDGKSKHMFWDAAISDTHPRGYEAHTIPVQTTPGIPHTVNKAFPIARLDEPDRVARLETVMRIRPMGMDVLQDLVESGDLDSDILARVPTFTAWSTLGKWKRGQGTVMKLEPSPLHCPESYLCLLQPGSMWCDKLATELEADAGGGR